VVAPALPSTTRACLWSLACSALRMASGSQLEVAGSVPRLGRGGGKRLRSPATSSAGSQALFRGISSDEPVRACQVAASLVLANAVSMRHHQLLHASWLMQPGRASSGLSAVQLAEPVAIERALIVLTQILSPLAQPRRCNAPEKQLLSHLRLRNDLVHSPDLLWYWPHKKTLGTQLLKRLPPLWLVRDAFRRCLSVAGNILLQYGTR
jgi:hypothetical protein